MKELLDTLAGWRAAGTDPAGIGRAVVVRTFGSAPRPEGAVLLYAADGRIAGSVSGGCVEGAAAEEIERARATGHARVIRYGISDEQAWDVGLACGGTIDVLVEPIAPAVVVDAARRSVGAGGHGSAVITPLPADSPPGEFGPHAAGRRRAARDRADRHRRRPADRVARRRRRSMRALVEAATAALRRGPVADGRARRSVAVHRGLPGPARGSSSSAGWRSPGRSCGSPASSASRPSSSTAGPRSPRRSASPTSTAWSSAGRTRSPTRSASGRTTPSPSCRTTSSSTSRPSSKRSRRGCRYVGAVGSKQDAGGPPRPAARGRRRRGGPGAAARAGRARPGRAGAGRDGAGDPGRDRRRALRRQRAADARTGAGDRLTAADEATARPRRWEDAGMTGVTGLILAAGAGSRFGGGKLLATIGGRPVLGHVLDTIAAAGLTDVVVVLGADAEAIEAAIDWNGERRVVNPAPERGLSSSLQVGFEAVGSDVGAILVALGDQPLVSVDAIRALLDAPVRKGRPIVVPAYDDEHGAQPRPDPARRVRARRRGHRRSRARAGHRRASGAGRRGAGRRVQPGRGHAAPTSPGRSRRRGRPACAPTASRSSGSARSPTARTSTPRSTRCSAPTRRGPTTRSSDALLRLVRSGETWLDVGAGAGRFALPIARALDPSGGSVVALDASPSMLEGLREIAEDYAIENVRTVEARWPPADPRGPRRSRRTSR